MQKLLQIDPEEFLKDIKDLSAGDAGRIIYCLCHVASERDIAFDIMYGPSHATEVYDKWKDKLFPKQLPTKTADNRPAEIIKYLNLVASTGYRINAKKNLEPIMARLKEGYTMEDFKRVIDVKVAKWINDPKMISFIRPETLFGPKFEGYLNEKVAPASNFERTANSVLKSSSNLKEKFANERANKNRT